MSQLKKFNQLYNKFIFQWSQGKNCSEFNDLSEDCPKNTEISSGQYVVVQPLKYNIQNPDRIAEIRQAFNKQFPKYLLKKCQVKFPFDDNMEIPQNIIDWFWNNYSQHIIDRFAQVTADKIIQKMLNVFIQIFGKEDQYNQRIFNDTALTLASILE